MQRVRKHTDDGWPRLVHEMRALVVTRGRLARDSLGNIFRRGQPTNGDTTASTAPKPESEATKFRKEWLPKELVDYE